METIIIIMSLILVCNFAIITINYKFWKYINSIEEPDKEFCGKCNCLREYEIIDEKYEIKFENKLYKYDGKKAVCKFCNYEVYNEEVEIYNQIAFEKEYLKKEYELKNRSNNYG